MRFPFGIALFVFALAGWALVLLREYPQTTFVPFLRELQVMQESEVPQEVFEEPEGEAIAEETEVETEVVESAAAVEPGPLEANPPAPEPILVGSTEQAEPPIQYTEEYVELLEQAVHEKINVERVREGLDILTYDEILAEVAGGHSTDMAKNNYFAHEDDDGCTSSCRVNAAGYKWRFVGENLFLLRSEHRYTVEDAAAIIVTGWLGSEGHRKNVLNKNFTTEGVGVVVLGNTLYATEVFAKPR